MAYGLGLAYLLLTSNDNVMAGATFVSARGAMPFPKESNFIVYFSTKNC